MQTEAPQLFVVPLPLPQFNDVIRAAKAHFGTYANAKKKHTTAIWWLARAAKLRPLEPPYALTFSWRPEDRRVDPDNISHGVKYALDGLVRAGILAGDGYQKIRELRHLFLEPDPAHPRVEVLIARHYDEQEVAP